MHGYSRPTAMMESAFGKKEKGDSSDDEEYNGQGLGPCPDTGPVVRGRVCLRELARCPVPRTLKVY